MFKELSNLSILTFIYYAEVIVIGGVAEGRTFEVSCKVVECVLEDLDPEPIRDRAKYYIEYKGRKYPIKQVVPAVTGLPGITFAATHAYRVLTTFEIKELVLKKACR